MGTDQGDRIKNIVLERLERFNISPNENLGQHFLVDDGDVVYLANIVNPGNTVIEVGAGIGQLTEELAKRASKVVTIELDRRYEPVLSELASRYPNVEVIYADAIHLPLQKYIVSDRDESETQIVASLPFHISEPFLHKIIGLSIESATLVIGDKLAYSLQCKEDSADFSKLSILAQTFFDIELLKMIEKQNFYPPPRTRSAVIQLTPKEEYRFRSSKRDFIFRRLFMTAKKNPLVKNCIKEALIEHQVESKIGTRSKKESSRRERKSIRTELNQFKEEYNSRSNRLSVNHRERIPEMTQNQARDIIAKMNLPKGLLDKPFEQLNNNELQLLYAALK